MTLCSCHQFIKFYAADFSIFFYEFIVNRVTGNKHFFRGLIHFFFSPLSCLSLTYHLWWNVIHSPSPCFVIIVFTEKRTSVKLCKTHAFTQQLLFVKVFLVWEIWIKDNHNVYLFLLDLLTLCISIIFLTVISIYHSPN